MLTVNVKTSSCHRDTMENAMWLTASLGKGTINSLGMTEVWTQTFGVYSLRRTAALAHWIPHYHPLLCHSSSRPRIVVYWISHWESVRRLDYCPWRYCHVLHSRSLLPVSLLRRIHTCKALAPYTGCRIAEETTRKCILCRRLGQFLTSHMKGSTPHSGLSIFAIWIVHLSCIFPVLISTMSPNILTRKNSGSSRIRPVDKSRTPSSGYHMSSVHNVVRYIS